MKIIKSLMANKRRLAAFLLAILSLTAAVHGVESPLELGQLIMVGFSSTEVSPGLRRSIEEGKIGGVLLLGKNVRNPQQFARLMADLKAIPAPAPLLIALDQEGGRVVRLSPAKGFPGFPTARIVAQQYSTAEAYALYSQMALMLKDYGVNVNFVPVVDIDINPNSPIIGQLGRSFSADPAMVASYAEQMILAHRAQGIITCAKHFPGHGSATVDSHLGITDVTTSWSSLELSPYRYLLAHQLLDLVMPAHIYNQAIDQAFPASLSKKHLQGILRGEIGYQGVIISDDLMMGGVTTLFSFEAIVLNALQAGEDILLFSSTDPRLAEKITAVIGRGLADGRLSAAEIRLSLERIKRLKERLAH